MKYRLSNTHQRLVMLILHDCHCIQMHTVYKPDFPISLQEFRKLFPFIFLYLFWVEEICYKQISGLHFFLMTDCTLQRRKRHFWFIRLSNSAGNPKSKWREVSCVGGSRQLCHHPSNDTESRSNWLVKCPDLSLVAMIWCMSDVSVYQNYELK